MIQSGVTMSHLTVSIDFSANLDFVLHNFSFKMSHNKKG